MTNIEAKIENALRELAICSFHIEQMKSAQSILVCHGRLDAFYAIKTEVELLKHQRAEIENFLETHSEVRDRALKGEFGWR